MKQLIGVDLGGTRLRAVRMDTAGHIFQHRSGATAATTGPEAVISQIVSLVAEVISAVSRRYSEYRRWLAWANRSR